MLVPCPSGRALQFMRVTLIPEVVRTGSLEPLVDEARSRAYRFLDALPFLPLWRVREIGAASVYGTLDLEWEALEWEVNWTPEGRAARLLGDFLQVVRPLGESPGIVQALGEWSGSGWVWTDALGRVWEDYGLEGTP